MARRIKFEKGNYYHIFNRGAHKARIFRKADDYRFLHKRIGKYFNRDSIAMIAYCLMPNHYHFLVLPDGNVSFSQTMQSIFNSYSKGFNSWYQHTGTIFEGPFKSLLVDSEEYLFYLCRYIHRNPVYGEHPLVENLPNWPHSNYLEWIGTRNDGLFDMEFANSTFPGYGSYVEFVYNGTSSKVHENKFKKYLYD